MNKKYTYLIIVLLVIASLAAYGRILGNDFVNYDDDRLITGNHYIQTGLNAESIKWAFTNSSLEYWHPLTWLSIMLEWRLFGANASFYHLVSLLLHIGAVLFLFLFLNKATKRLWPSAFAAALFALHPLRVESVAWAAEYKDVLSMFFGMATLYVYAQYVEKRRISKYFICLILFTLSLMSKPTLVTLPCVLLLLDYWPLKRWPKPFTPVNIPAMEKKTDASAKGRSPVIANLLWEKAPFFLLSMLLGIMLIGQLRADNYMIPLQQLSFSTRMMNTIVSYVSYLGKTFRPVDLACFYPYSFQLWQVAGAAFVLLIMTVVVIYYMKKLPFLFVGWFWYLGTLFPVSGLMQAGAQAMADRYTYLPSVGIAIMLAWGIPLLFKREDTRKKILFPAGMAVIAILAVLTWQQCGNWRNSIDLFKHALQVTKDNSVAHNGFASALVKKGRIEEAIDHYNKAIRLTPEYAEAYYDRGIAYTKLGQYQMAINDFSKAIHLKPKDAHTYYYNRGIAYDKFGQYQMAIEDFNNAIRLKEDYANAYNSRGAIYTKFGQYQMAIEDYNKAIRLKPNDADAYNNRGIIYTKFGQYQMAIEDFNNAIRLKSDDADTYFNRGFVYFNQGNIISGCNDAKKACELGNCKILEAAKAKGLCH
ncbi:MAG: tetratricopeptide repeat protein [Smithella sp.]